MKKAPNGGPYKKIDVVHMHDAETLTRCQTRSTYSVVTSPNVRVVTCKNCLRICGLWNQPKRLKGAHAGA
jgi:hypothetical protein